MPTEDLAMLIMHRGFELVPFKDGEKWLAQIFSGGRRIATTMPFFSEELAMTEARKFVDEMRNSTGSARSGRRP
jgi:hypothetical protein